MKLSEIFTAYPGISLADNNKNIEITGIAYDSRNVKQGDLFICIKGFKTDGHHYIKNAIDLGAAAVVVQDETDASGIPLIKVEDTRMALALLSAKFFGNPADSFKLVGVTGTNGKTTVTYLIKTILEMTGKKVGLIGTNQNMIGESIIHAERTTPESYELQRLFRRMADESVDYVVMEVSSHSLELSRVGGLKFEVGIFTNLTQDHLDFHESMEAYFEAKKKLFDASINGVVNADDSYGKSLIEDAPCEILTYGVKQEADLKARDIKMSPRGVIFNTVRNKEEIQTRLGIPGMFSVYNALAAMGGCLALGIPMEEIIKGLMISKGVAGRAEVHHYPNFTVMIDYAHTPDGLQNVLDMVNEIKTGRVVTVFGCGGDRDKTKRPKMGKIAGENSDFSIITSDNPRTENPTAIIADVEVGMKETSGEYIIIENRYDAIKYALLHANKDDIILLAGKGHETYQILKDKTIDFDERKVVEEIMSQIS